MEVWNMNAGLFGLGGNSGEEADGLFRVMQMPGVDCLRRNYGEGEKSRGNEKRDRGSYAISISCKNKKFMI